MRHRHRPWRGFAAAVLACCGLVGASVSVVAVAAPPGFPASAHQTLHRVTRLEGEDHGLAYATQRALLDTCNNMRAAFYEAPPLAIDDAVLRSLDEQTIEKYYAADRAAQFVTGRGLRLVDFERWSAAQRAGDAKPAQPPDCSQYTLAEIRNGTLWRDGLRYQLSWSARRAVAAPAPADFRPRELLTPQQFALQPQDEIRHRPCRRVVAPSNGILDGRSCAWAEVPFVAWLNWPWSLESESRFGLPQKLVQHDTLESMEVGGIVPPGVFDIPAGFAVVGPAVAPARR